MKKENKNLSVTFRLSKSEKDKAIEKTHHAGYKTISAFIRDYFINNEPKEKIQIPNISFELIPALARLSTLVNSKTTRKEFTDEILKMEKIILGAADDR